MNPKLIFNLLRDTFKDWNEDKAARLGAALSYYTLFSIGPLLVVVIAIASVFFEHAGDQIAGTIGSIIGPDAETMLVKTMENANKGGADVIATVIGVVTLLLGAAG